MKSCSGDLIAGVVGTSIKVRNLTDGSEKEIHEYTRRGVPAISHGGRDIAFIESGSNSASLLVATSGGGAARELAVANSPVEFFPQWGLAWSPDDRFVYFIRRPDAHSAFELFRVPATGGTPESVGLKAEGLQDLDIAPDGTRIAFVIRNGNQPELWSLQNFLPARK